MRCFIIETEILLLEEGFVTHFEDVLQMTPNFSSKCPPAFDCQIYWFNRGELLQWFSTVSVGWRLLLFYALF